MVSGGRGPVALVVASCLALAGCAGNGGTDETRAEGEPLADVDTGSIDGVVVDGAIRPVEGAVVRLADRMNTVTDAEGRFTFTYLEPGAFALAAERDGYAPAQVTVEVIAGLATDVKIVLELIPLPTPFVEVFQWSGVMMCGIAWTDPALGNQATSCNGITRTVPGFPSDLDASGIAIPIGSLANVTGIWAELSWDAQTPAAAVMEANWGYSVDAERAFFEHVTQARGPSVLGARIPIADLHSRLVDVESAFCSVEACELYGIPTSSSSFGTPGADVGGGFEQSFEAFVTVFHHGVFPETYSIAEGAALH